MNGLAARSSQATRNAASTAEMASAAQPGCGSDIKNTSRAASIPAKSAMPPTSIRFATAAIFRPAADGSSRGIHASVIASAAAVSGTLSRNAERHPRPPTRRPPIGGPIATVAEPAIARLPSTLPGGSPSPAWWERRRMISIAVG